MTDLTSTALRDAARQANDQSLLDVHLPVHPLLVVDLVFANTGKPWTKRRWRRTAGRVLGHGVRRRS